MSSVELLQKYEQVSVKTMFKENLKKLRQENNITQKQLALSVGMSERGIQNYELGEREPSLTVLIKLADYFNISIDYLVGRTDNPKINK